jgi:hypothetical protein
VRILSNHTNPSSPGDAAVVSDLLAEMCGEPHHRFWPADIQLATVVRPGQAFSHAHITDLYLLGLAVRNDGKFATFDRRIPAFLIEGGEQALTVIPM